MSEIVRAWEGSVYIATPLGVGNRLLVINGEPRRSQATEVLCLHRSFLLVETRTEWKGQLRCG